MTNFRNLKIQINDQQPLDEVLKQVKRIGFYIGFVDDNDKWISARQETKLIVSFEGESMLPDYHWKLTTLAELKEM